MTEQPEALRLADELEMWTQGEPAAAELRRLQSVNAQLLEALESVVEAIVPFRSEHAPDWWKSARAAIKAAKEQS